MKLKTEKNDLKEKSFNFTKRFDKKKCQFSTFPSFQFCPILEIENLETSESFRLLQFFIISVPRLKHFIEFQISRHHAVSRQINIDTVYNDAPIYACFFLNDVNRFLRTILRKERRFINTSHKKHIYF